MNACLRHNNQLRTFSKHRTFQISRTPEIMETPPFSPTQTEAHHTRSYVSRIRVVSTCSVLGIWVKLVLILNYGLRKYVLSSKMTGANGCQNAESILEGKRIVCLLQREISVSQSSVCSRCPFVYLEKRTKFC